MEKYNFLNFSDQEKSYFDHLYDTCRQGGLVEGKKAVDFFKLSNLSPPILREIWNNSSVYHRAYLTKEEFQIYMKFTALAQQGYTITIESLKSNHTKTDLPRFQGIPLPPPPPLETKKTNPFDMFENDQDQEEDFEDFQEAKSGHEGTTSSSSYKVNHQTLESNLMQIPFQQLAPTLIQMQNIQFPMQTSYGLQDQGRGRQINDQSTRTQVLENDGNQLSSRSEKKEEPTNYDDMIYRQMKKIPKMAPKMEPPKIEQIPVAWADFNATSFSDQNQPKNRYDLINEAFEELVSGKQELPKQNEPTIKHSLETHQTQPHQPQLNLLDLQFPLTNLPHIQPHQQPEENDDFDDFVDAPSASQQQQQEHQINLDDLLSSYNQTQSQIQNQKSFTEMPKQPTSLIDEPNFDHNQLKADNEEEDEGFDEFVEAVPVPTFEEQKQQPNITQASKFQFQADFGSFSQEGENREENKLNLLDQGWVNSMHVPSQRTKSISDEAISDQQHQVQLQTQDDVDEKEDDDFGDWNDAKQMDVVMLSERESEHRPSVAQDLNQATDQENKQVNTKEEIQNNDLLMFDEPKIEQEPQPVVTLKPKIELNENNLLSGFMKEFGLNIFQQAQQQQQQIQEVKEVKMVQESKSEKRKVEFESQASEEVLEQLNQKLNQYFGSTMSPSKQSEQYDSLTKEQYEQKIQSNKEKLRQLSDYLKRMVELSDSEINSSIGKQIAILDKIDKKNKKKGQAAIDEDYEKAAKYKKQILQLQNQMVGFEEVQGLLRRKPVLSLKELVQRVIKIDPYLHFSKYIVKEVCEEKAQKAKIAIQTMMFLKQIDIGMLNIKKRLEEIIYTFSSEIKVIDQAYESISNLEQEEQEILLEEPKFQKFLRGIGVLITMIELYQQSLIVAEAQEDYEYSMDIEALLQEVNQAQEQMQSSVSKLLSLNINFSNYLQIRNISLENTNQLDQALQLIKDHQHDVSDIHDLCCSQCSNSFFLTDFTDSITYNGLKYHPFCINFWLNKVSKQQ